MYYQLRTSVLQCLRANSKADIVNNYQLVPDTANYVGFTTHVILAAFKLLPGNCLPGSNWPTSAVTVV